MDTYLTLHRKLSSKRIKELNVVTINLRRKHGVNLYVTSLGTFHPAHLPIWALSAYLLGPGQAVGKGIPTLGNQPCTQNTPLS